METAGGIALIENYLLNECDDFPGRLDQFSYKTALNRYLNYISAYVEMIKNRDNPLRALQILIDNHQVIGTGKFGLEILTRCFANPNQSLEEKFREIQDKEKDVIDRRMIFAEHVDRQISVERDTRLHRRWGIYARPQHPSTDS